MLAISEQNLQSLYSSIAEYIAAPLPPTITFPVDPFPLTTKTSIEIAWNQPTINSVNEIPIISYRIYWDEGYLSSGSFSLLAEINSYDQTFYTATNLVMGNLYKF